jgi:hypothetical protein
MKKRAIAAIAFVSLFCGCTALIALTTEAPPKKVSPKPAKVEPVAVVEEKPAIVPLTPEEKLHERLVINTPGMLAKEHAGLLNPHGLYHDFFPLLCDVTTDESIPLDQVRSDLTDLAQRKFGVDQKLAANMAEGMITTSLEPGACP